jgi:hypothetical protein
MMLWTQRQDLGDVTRQTHPVEALGQQRGDPAGVVQATA